jgi:hypothetical protein
MKNGKVEIQKAKNQQFRSILRRPFIIPLELILRRAIYDIILNRKMKNGKVEIQKAKNQQFRSIL